MNRIREIREDLDLRQSDVAAKTGIDQRTISNYETGKTNPDSYSIIKLAEFFNVSTDYLLGYQTPNNQKVKEINEKIEQIEETINEIKRILKTI